MLRHKSHHEAPAWRTYSLVFGELGIFGSPEDSVLGHVGVGGNVVS